MQKLCALCGTPISPTQNLVLEQQFEIQGVNTVEKYFGTRTLLTVKLNVFSESVLRLGGNPPEYPNSKKSSQTIGWIVGSTPNRELDSIDGGPVVFEWKISPRRTALQLPQEVHKVMGEEPSITPQDFKNHIISSCRCTTISIGTEKSMKQCANDNSPRVTEYAKSFLKGQLSFR